MNGDCDWPDEGQTADEADELVQRLRSIAAVVDQIPIEVFETAISSFRWRSIDAELAELLFDSAHDSRQLAGVRSPAGSRQLMFETAHFVVEVEVDLEAQRQLVGQLIPPGPADVEIRSSHASTVVKADGLGRFWTDRIVGPAMSLRVTPEGHHGDPANTPWVTIAPSRPQGESN